MYTAASTLLRIHSCTRVLNNISSAPTAKTGSKQVPRRNRMPFKGFVSCNTQITQSHTPHRSFPGGSRCALAFIGRIAINMHNTTSYGEERHGSSAGKAKVRISPWLRRLAVSSKLRCTPAVKNLHEGKLDGGVTSRTKIGKRNPGGPWVGCRRSRQEKVSCPSSTARKP